MKVFDPAPLRRLGLTAAALFLAAMAGVGAALGHGYARTLEAELGAKLAALGATVARQIGVALESGIPLERLEGMTPFLAAFLGPDPESPALVIADAAGVVRYAAGPLAPAPGTRLTAEPGMEQVVVPLLVAGERQGTIRLALPRDYGVRAAFGLWLPLAVLLVAGTAIALLICELYLRRRLVRPLRDCEAALAQAASGDFRALAPELETALELGRAAAALGAVLAAEHEGFCQDIAELALAQPEPEARARIEALAAAIAARFRFPHGADS